MAQTDEQFFQQQQSAPPIITEPSADGAEMAANDAESLAATGTFLSFYANFRRFHHNAQPTTATAESECRRLTVRNAVDQLAACQVESTASAAESASQIRWFSIFFWNQNFRGRTDRLTQRQRLEERHKTAAVEELERRQSRRKWDDYEQRLRIHKLEAEIEQLAHKANEKGWVMPEQPPMERPWWTGVFTNSESFEIVAFRINLITLSNWNLFHRF